MARSASSRAPPAGISDLIARVDGTLDLMPERLRQCALFTRDHLHLVAVSTVADMAGAAGVAPSVYIRFCQALGFSGYSEMQALFRERYTAFRPDYGERLARLGDGADDGGDDGTDDAEGARATRRQASGPEAPPSGAGALLSAFAESGHKSLIALGNSVTSSVLERIALGMAEARIVHLAGVRRAFAVVGNMAYLLGRLDVPTVLHGGTGPLDAGSAIGPGDALLAVSFAPFSPETVDLARVAAQRGARVFGLTDAEPCPLAGHASELLIARESEVAGFRAPTAAIVLTTALAIAVGAARGSGGSAPGRR